MMSAKNNKTVYSTDPNWKPQNQEKDQAENVRQGTVHIWRETKGRSGKTVTVVKGLIGNLKTWKKELQKVCGAGGTVKGNEVEIQGNNRDKIADYLNSKGIKTKFSGG